MRTLCHSGSCVRGTFEPERSDDLRLMCQQRPAGNVNDRLALLGQTHFAAAQRLGSRAGRQQLAGAARMQTALHQFDRGSHRTARADRSAY